jgi:hypothetical protein
MYPYGGVAIQHPHHPQHHQQQHHQHQQQHQQHQQPHQMQHISRPSPPHPTWAIPQSHSHSQYYPMPPKAPVSTTREEQQQQQQRYVSRTDVTAAHSPALSTATYRPDNLGTTDYFPGVIDTSRFLHPPLRVSAKAHRSLGSKGLRRVGFVPIHGPGAERLQSWLHGP